MSISPVSIEVTRCEVSIRLECLERTFKSSSIWCSILLAHFLSLVEGILFPVYFRLESFLLVSRGKTGPEGSKMTDKLETTYDLFLHDLRAVLYLERMLVEG